MLGNLLFHRAALLLAAETPTETAGHGAYILAGGLVAIALGIATFWLTRRRTSAAAPPILPPPRAQSSAAPPAPAAGSATATVGELIPAFLRWLGEHEDGDELWTSFDQLVRETLSDALGATRVRCYHARPGEDTLLPISQVGKTPAAKAAVRRDGLLGHVATTGREYVSSDAGPQSLLRELAAASDEPWAWVWPIRGPQATLGLVAVGQPPEPARLTAAARQVLGPQLTLCWQHVTCLERLRVVQRTDQASGVLTRNDFFTLARHALGASYHAHEPVVVGVFALEGLRRLDDTGHWRERDDLIEQLGTLIAHRVRSDDLVGRFADDRFVVLLRRLDSGLGRLIADKLLTAATECTAAIAAERTPLRVRIGLSGSGGRQPALEELLVGAFEAVEHARRHNLPVVGDTDSPRAEGNR